MTQFEHQQAIRPKHLAHSQMVGATGGESLLAINPVNLGAFEEL